MFHVTVFHNIATDAEGRLLGLTDGYKDGHPLVPVYQYTAAAPTNTSNYALLPAALVTKAADATFALLNVGTGFHADAYRADGNRSLSVGDVLCIVYRSQETGDQVVTWLAVDRFSFTEISRPHWFARDAAQHGTHPMNTTLSVG